MAVFAVRLSREAEDISYVKILGKFAGAVGNYNAHLSAYPEISWPCVAEEFVQSLGLSFNPYVTQVGYNKLLFLFYVRDRGVNYWTQYFISLVGTRLQKISENRFTKACVKIEYVLT